MSAQNVYAYTLRDYQQDGIGAIREALSEHKRVVYVLPTGGGKGCMAGYLGWASGLKGARVIFVGHTIEIVTQLSQHLDTMNVAHGMILAGGEPDDQRVQVAMVQTLANRLDKVARPDLLIFDECHHCVASTWQKIMARWPDCYVVGFSATPARLDGRGLREAGFEKLVFGPDVADLIEMGHLAKFRYLGAQVASFEDVHTVAGDYDASEVEARMVTRAVTGDVVGHYRKHLEGRTCIAFCVTIKHAELVAAAYNEAGIPAASLDGSMGAAERKQVVDDLRQGRIKVLTSCQVISEGFDAPSVGGAQLLRPTQSFAMFRQQIGRCLRPKADGSEAVILDHVGNYTRHGLPDEPHAWDLDSEKRSAKERKAPKATTRFCRGCQTVFPAAYKAEPCPGVSNCAFKAVVPQQRAGELEDVMADRGWASIDELRFGPLHVLVRRAAGNPLRLRQIQMARGYKKGWVWMAQEDFRNRTGIWANVRG